VAQVYPVGLTSVRQPLEDVAVEIVRTLRSLLSHQPVDTRGVLLAPTLAIRESS
jgi:LacI family transcriptional regulator